MQVKPEKYNLSFKGDHGMELVRKQTEKSSSSTLISIEGRFAAPIKVLKEIAAYVAAVLSLV